MAIENFSADFHATIPGPLAGGAPTFRSKNALPKNKIPLAARAMPSMRRLLLLCAADKDPSVVLDN
jgi:hypothetical protein